MSFSLRGDTVLKFQAKMLAFFWDVFRKFCHSDLDSLLQQPDQLILSTLPRPASRALLSVCLRRLLRLSLLRASTSDRRRRGVDARVSGT